VGNSQTSLYKELSHVKLPEYRRCEGGSLCLPDMTVRFLAYLLSLRSTILLKHLLFIGCSYPIYEIQNKLNALATFNVTGNEAKRNVVRSLAKGAGVDPVAAFKA